jgi:hypothetical protein
MWGELRPMRGVLNRLVPEFVRYWHKADISLCAANVRYWG